MFPEAFHHKGNGRTDATVPGGNAQYGRYVPSVGVRIFHAGLGSFVIYAATVIGLKKRTGEGFENMITVFILPDIFFDKQGRFHSGMFSQTVNIFSKQEWSGSLAAIGAQKTVYFLKRLDVELIRDFIENACLLFFETLQKLSVGCLVFGCALDEFSVFRIHFPARS
jgi:hypothetical protein